MFFNRACLRNMFKDGFWSVSCGTDIFSPAFTSVLQCIFNCFVGAFAFSKAVLIVTASRVWGPRSLPSLFIAQERSHPIQASNSAIATGIYALSLSSGTQKNVIIKNKKKVKETAACLHCLCVVLEGKTSWISGFLPHFCAKVLLICFLALEEDVCCLTSKSWNDWQ